MGNIYIQNFGGLKMKEQNGSENKVKKEKRFSNEKRFYVWTASGCAATLVAIVLIAVLVNSLNHVDVPAVNNSSPNLQTPIDPGDGGGKDDNQPVITPPEGMIMPIESVSVCNDYGFYYNKTLNQYHEHMGVDFVAAVGAEVVASEKGTIENIYQNDVLTGTEIVINHGNGLKTVYRFVDVKDGIRVGASVKKGDVIGTIAEATGEEYKDGAHLHFEIKKNGVAVDPATYLTFEEK